MLREERGCAEEEVESGAPTPRALFDELKALHGFTLNAEQLKVVVNDAFAMWDVGLEDGDSVVFIPPVAGG